MLPRHDVHGSNRPCIHARWYHALKLVICLAPTQPRSDLVEMSAVDMELLGEGVTKGGSTSGQN